MWKRLRISLSRPKLLVFFIQDSFFNVISYILLLTTLLILPNLIKLAVNNEMDLNRKELLYEALLEFADFEIKDGTLIISNTEYVHFEHFTVILDGKAENMRYNIVLSKNDLVFYVAELESKRVSYTDLGIDNLILNKDNLENYRILTDTIETFLQTEKVINVSDIILAYLLNLSDYIAISFMLVIMTLFFPTMMKFTFSNRFRITAYLMTSWVLSQLIVRLFQIEFLEIVSLIVVYIYHVYLYRFLRYFKVEVTNVNE
mgnify:CR=1 FL=1